MANRIGIISYHSDPNYGTMYQAYALAKAIKDLGGVPEYIQYEAIPYRSPLKATIIRTIKSMLEVLQIHKRPLTEYSFLRTKEFRNLVLKYKVFHDTYIPVSEKVYFANTADQANGVYDYFVVGSDQTWSPACNVNPKTSNFLSFVADKNKKRAYAPSVGSIHISSDYKSRLIKELSGFEHLSCREYANAKMLSGALDKPVQHVLDPTLLLKTDEWQKIEKEVSMPDKYILCYILGTKQCISDYAELLGNSKGIPVYYMVTRPEYLGKKNRLIDIGPSEFLYLLRRASYVVTDSFHGTMFSINFNRNFYSFAKRVTTDATGLDNDRIMDFLTLVGLECRFINDGETRLESDIDFVPVNDYLTKTRVESIKYLTKIISK